MLLNNHRVIEETRGEIEIFLGLNENANTTYQILWDTAKAILREKFIVMSAYFKQSETSQILRFTKIRISQTQN
jgi:hypothetical protein